MVITDRLNGKGGKYPVAKYSSIKSLGKYINFEDVLRGDSSLGKCISDQGEDVVPSPNNKSPLGSPVGTRYCLNIT